MRYSKQSGSTKLSAGCTKVRPSRSFCSSVLSQLTFPVLWGRSGLGVWLLEGIIGLAMFFYIRAVQRSGQRRRILTRFKSRVNSYGKHLLISPLLTVSIVKSGIPMELRTLLKVPLPSFRLLP